MHAAVNVAPEDKRSQGSNEGPAEQSHSGGKRRKKKKQKKPAPAVSRTCCTAVEHGQDAESSNAHNSH